MPRRAIMSIFLITLAGCAGRLNYTGPEVPASPTPVKNLHQPFDRAWNATLKAFQDRGYTVASADKRVGAIGLRLSGSPQPFIDCGQVQSMVATPRAEITRVYEFAGSAPHSAYEQLMRGNIWDVTRDMHMDAIVDVQLRPVGGDRTVATLGARYRLTRTVTLSNATDRHYEPIIDTVTFTSGSKGRFPGNERATECVATGALEREILDSIL